MEFNVVETTNKIIEDIRTYYKNNNALGAVIGISGGKDSAVCASLLCKAIGSDNIEAFWLPCYSNDSDKIDAYKVCESLNIKLHEHDLTETYEMITNDIKKKYHIDNDTLLMNANINLKPRLRMSILYYYAAYFSALKDGLYLVCGTSNKSELFVGYFTKGGDSVYDIAPLKNLYVDEVIQIGDYLGSVPKRIIHKTPDDGLSGKSDEEKLGFSYNDVKKVSLEMEKGIKSDIDSDVKNKILTKHYNNLHKFNTPNFGKIK